MERKEMKKRAKGLLALLLAFIMMFGTSLTVFAAGTTYELNCDNGTVSPQLQGATVNVGDKIGLTGSGFLKVVINGNTEFDKSPATVGLPNAGRFSYDLESGPYKASVKIVKDTNTNNFYFFTVTLTTPGSGSATNNTGSKSKKKDSTGTGYSHEHYFQWVESIEPTEEHDGLMEFKCACGAVDDSYVMSGSMAFVKKVVKLIQTAPQNGTVDITTKNYSCYTAWIIEELAKRPDVSLKTTYTDAEGNVKTFTIPAGQAPTDGAEFYGFTYLGNKYGWN